MLKRTIMLSTSVALALSIAAPSFAQQGEDEIIVTATKRQQTLQEVPVAVSVTGAATIEKAKIQDISDLQSVVPSLRVTQLQTSANTNFVIRGFGNGANNAGIEPSVGIFIDGVYRSRSAAAIGDLPKLERVEVLRGPQSTLFGKNASAGVISVVTAKPSFETTGFVEAGYGSYNQINGKGYFSTAIGENAAFSVSGGINKRDGYAESLNANSDDSNDRNRWNVRGQLLFQPSDNAEIRVIADYSEIDEVCCNVALVRNFTGTFNGANVNGHGTFQALSALGARFSPGYNDEFQLNREANNTVEDMGISVHGDVDFGDFTLTSISAYRANDSAYIADQDYTNLDLLENVNNAADIDTYSQEIRLTSNGGDEFDWMVGGYLFKEDITQVSGLNYGANLRSYIDILAGGPATLGAIEAFNGFAPGSFFNDNVDITETFTQDNTAYSLFGNVDWHATDRLTATVGLNYTNDDKTLTGSTVNNDLFSNIDLAGTAGFNTLVGGGLAANFPNVALACTGQSLAFSPANVATVSGVAACPFIPGNPSGAQAYGGLQAQVVAGVSALDLTNPAQNPLLGLQPLQFQPQFLAFPNSVEPAKSSDDKVTYSFKLAFEATDNVNFYGSYSTGFKASSWNLSRDSRPFATDRTAIEAAGLNVINQSYGTRFAEPEEATVLEFGMKTRFSNGAFNFTVFDQSIKGFQSNIFQGTGFVLANAGKQSTFGVEMDGTWTPWSPLTLGFAATFLDPKYDDYTGAAGPFNTTIDLSGETPAGIHKTSASLSATYTHDFANGAEGYIRGDYLYESRTKIVDNIPDLYRTVNTVNASAGFSMDNGFGVQVWARNVFNDRYLLSVFPGVAQTGLIYGYPNQPRTYGISLRKDF